MVAQKPESATQFLSRESAYQEFLQNVLAFPGGDLHPGFQASKAILRESSQKTIRRGG
jgi:hypothetical protein